MFCVQRIRAYISKVFIVLAQAAPAASVAVAETESKIIECIRVCWCRCAATFDDSDHQLSACSQSVGRYRLSVFNFKHRIVRETFQQAFYSTL